MNRVVLEGLEFYAKHGVYESEAVLGSRFVVDAELYYPFVGLPDDLDAAVSYADVFELIRDEVTTKRHQLIEVVADRVARRILQEQPKLEKVMVRVHKPFAPLPGVFRDVFAELTLKQSEL